MSNPDDSATSMPSPLQGQALEPRIRLLLPMWDETRRCVTYGMHRCRVGTMYRLVTFDPIRVRILDAWVEPEDAAEAYTARSQP